MGRDKEGGTEKAVWMGMHRLCPIDTEKVATKAALWEYDRDEDAPPIPRTCCPLRLHWLLRTKTRFVGQNTKVGKAQIIP